MDPVELSALAGAGSALVAALSYWAKTNHERRRVTRTVLYYLLELHHMVHRIRTAVAAIESELVKELKAACEARGIPFDEEATAAEVKRAKPAFAEFGRKQLEGSVAASADAFSKALSDLARENPILAFRLHGRDQVSLIREKIEAFATDHVGIGPVPCDAQDVAWSGMDDLILSLSVEDLRKAIRSTAWGCDVVTHLRTVLLLRASAREQTSGELNQVVTQIAENYVASRSAQDPSRR